MRDLSPNHSIDCKFALQLREVCHQQNQPACQGLLEQIRQNFQGLKSKLEVFMQLEQQKKQLQGSQ